MLKTLNAFTPCFTMKDGRRNFSRNTSKSSCFMRMLTIIKMPWKLEHSLEQDRQTSVVNLSSYFLL